MKDFMMIFVGTSYSEINLSPEDMQQRMGKWMSWEAKMKAAGVYKSGNALTPDLVRVVGPDRTVTDRASTELKELVGGYYIVSANSSEEVIEIAQDYPDYDLGNSVEIREIMVFE